VQRRTGAAIADTPMDAQQRETCSGSIHMAAKSIHVVPAGNRWVVEENGQHISTHSTQSEAEAFGRDEALRAHAELVVHGRDGQIERKNSYGHDPRDIRG